MRAALLLFLAGCISTGDTRCPDSDLICPEDTVCASVVEWAPASVDASSVYRCVPAADLATCREQPDGMPCDPAGPATVGECHSGACFEAVCGNHFQDANEACDDANLTSGDGCAAGCGSDESCGNGLIDLVAGETCDDGGRAARDGCSVKCKIERPRWREIITDDVPERDQPRMFYDSLRAQLVMFGGFALIEERNDTWVGRTVPCEPDHDCLAWMDVSSSLRPPARHAHAMAFDQARGVGVLFGGAAATIGPLDDTWTWDGRRWTLLTPAHRPPKRARAAMAYDPGRGVTVLFGGTATVITPIDDTPVPSLGDTWEWDGTDWREVTVAVAPPSQAGHAMVYDPSTGRLLLVGQGETWVYEGTTWTPVHPATSPPAVIDFGLTFDVASQQVLLLGGRFSSGPFNQTVWAWNGVTWGPLSPGIAPRSGVTMACDLRTGITVATGGSSDRSLVFDGVGWQPPAPVALPVGVDTTSALAYDSARDRVVLFLSNGHTWERSGFVWSFRVRGTTPSFPPLGESMSMTYDENVRETLLAVGTELWGWNGQTWTRHGLLPAQLSRVPIAYDRGRKRSVIVGGAGTFAWNGQAWQPITTNHLPPARSGGTLVHDVARDELVLFGGVSGNGGILGDTWVLANGDWVERTPLVGPVPRAQHAAAWNAARGRVTITGGLDVMETWEWTGDRWEEVSLDLAPSPRVNTAMTSTREGLVLVGGVEVSTGLAKGDTWTLQYESDEQVDECLGYDTDGDGLVGCADPDCAPVCGLCGNGTQEPAESCHTCPADFATGCVGTARCGDLICDAGEVCPGDCP